MLLGVTLVVSLMVCIFLKDQVQMPWWALVLASAVAFGFTLPISIITATTNQVKILELFFSLPLLTMFIHLIQKMLNTYKMQSS